MDPTRATALATELKQIIDEIGLSGSVRIERAAGLTAKTGSET